MKPASRWLLRPWVLYTALGTAATIFLVIFYGWIWVIRDADILISEEGIKIYDARSGPGSAARHSAPETKDLGKAVDSVYRLLRRCVPLRAGDEAAIKEVSLVFVTPESLRVLALLSLMTEAAALHSVYLKRIYVTEPGSIAHELIHRYLYVHGVMHAHSRENPAREHPLFAQCESQFVGPP